MKTDLEVEVEVDLRQLGKVIIFRDKQTNRQLLLYIDTYFLSIQLWDRCTMYRLFNSTEYWVGLVLARKLRMKIENWERDGLNFLPQ